jgi:hypothetical protein
VQQVVAVYLPLVVVIVEVINQHRSTTKDGDTKTDLIGLNGSQSGSQHPTQEETKNLAHARHHSVDVNATWESLKTECDELVVYRTS